VSHSEWTSLFVIVFFLGFWGVVIFAWFDKRLDDEEWYEDDE
jgi:hypothetical protein